MRAVRGLEGEEVEEVSAGFQHVVVRSRAGRAYAWGKGERGQLGTGRSEDGVGALHVDNQISTGLAAGPHTYGGYLQAALGHRCCLCG